MWLAKRPVANQPSERRRLTAELAQQLKILPARTSELASTNAGFLFDLPRVDPLHTKSRTSARDSNPHLGNTRKRLKKRRTVSSDKNKSLISKEFDQLKPPVIVNSVRDGNQAGDSVVPPSAAAVVSTATVIPKPIPDPFADSAIMFTLEPIPPAQSPCSGDEGPLQLDDETELINTLTASLVTSQRDEFGSGSAASSHPGYTVSPHNSNDVWSSSRASATLSNTNAVGEVSSRWSTMRTQICDPVRTTSNDTLPNSSGFIRTLMGGDVAYSLLRDAGMY
ncbi:unnamed protein product [Echinostoma caproni]|uniref:Uncharacterized protein n=1 Tax=Echinostoma caproni TaxID=27848 RepID=A0A183AVG8_9TREM|nr:unnamed protein product [Echinostoma caproni]